MDTRSAKKDNYDKLNMLSALQPAWRCHLNSARGRQSNAENVPDGPVGIDKSSEETDWIISHNSNGNMSSIVERIHTYSEIVSEILTFSLQADFFLRRKPFFVFFDRERQIYRFWPHLTASVKGTHFMSHRVMIMICRKVKKNKTKKLTMTYITQTAKKAQLTVMIVWLFSLNWL